MGLGNALADPLLGTLKEPAITYLWSARSVTQGARKEGMLRE